MKEIQHQLLDWFAHNARKLPWRVTYDPYHVWISEIMLQQTQMERVIDYFNRWMARFPEIKSIAGANEEEVLKLWEGLGYYARARNIIRAADIIVRDHDNTVPENHELLLRLPGIGKYTAGAIMSIAFNREYPLVDANIGRLFARLYNLDKPVKDRATHAFIWQKARELLPQGKARWFNQALMELGGLICIAKNPRCRVCPLSIHCLAYRNGITNERPVLTDPPSTIFIEMATGILQHDGRMLIQKRKPTGVWANLWEFPGGRLEAGETPEMALIREFQEETELSVGNLEKIITVQHSYTVYRVTLHCYFCTVMNSRVEPILHGAQEYRWVDASELSRYAFPAGHRKLIRHLADTAASFQDD
jgi:A/G-specific adenine glycosylase